MRNSGLLLVHNPENWLLFVTPHSEKGQLVPWDLQSFAPITKSPLKSPINYSHPLGVRISTYGLGAGGVQTFIR